jgi:protein-tyrosine phosphatase
MEILFVCTGNTCRSPMAQGLAKLYLAEEFKIYSAGINAFEGEHISKNASEVLKKKKIDQGKHRAVRLTKKMLDSADYVFTMTKSQEVYLSNLYPEMRDKITALGSWLGSEKEITDPWGGSLEVYHHCLLELDEMMEALAAILSTKHRTST